MSPAREDDDCPVPILATAHEPQEAGRQARQHNEVRAQGPGSGVSSKV